MLRVAMLALGALAAGCGPPGIPGEEGRAYFETSTLCFGCRYLDAFARGGHYEITTTLDYCGGAAGWDIEGSGAIDIESTRSIDGCTRITAFSAPRTGSFMLTIPRPDNPDDTIDRLTLSVVETDTLALRCDTITEWGRIDLDHLELPVGARVLVYPVAIGGDEPLVHDPALVTVTIEGDAVVDDPSDGETSDSAVDGAFDILAARVGTAIVRATLGDAVVELPVEVKPLDAIDESRPCGDFETHGERCDGVDNDMDGAIDETGGGGCRIPGAHASCEAGRCMECAPGYADCDERAGCETELASDAASCGRCGYACADGESCVEGTCTADP